MFIAIHHQIHDPELFEQKVGAMAPPPENLRRHQFLTSTDHTRASCLWEAPSVGPLRDYLDDALEPASTQIYFPVAEQGAVGLPSRQLS